jgi:hypothetical protein
VDVLDDLGAQSAIGGIPVVGILIALIGAVFLSLGAQFQHRGVEKVEARHGSGARAGLSLRQLLYLLGRPSWVVGTVMLGLAIVFQLTSLGFAPLIVVQPVGAVALVITAIVNARFTGVKIERPVLRAIAFCVLGIGIFVTVAAFVAEEQIVGETQLVVILSILGGVMVLLALTFAFARKRAGALFYIISAGVLYGFVATLAKVVINRLGNLMAGIVGGEFEWLTIGCVVALIAACRPPTRSARPTLSSPASPSSTRSSPSPSASPCSARPRTRRCGRSRCGPSPPPSRCTASSSWRSITRRRTPADRATGWRIRGSASPSYQPG